MRPEFYCLKYESLQTPAAILKDSVRIGWKCRKYQRWKQVHKREDDKEFLREIGDALVEQGEFDLNAFGRLSDILLNVQRWRFDKENLLQDPPRREGWDATEQLILLGGESKSLLKRQLDRIDLVS